MCCFKSHIVDSQCAATLRTRRKGNKKTIATTARQQARLSRYWEFDLDTLELFLDSIKSAKYTNPDIFDICIHDRELTSFALQAMPPGLTLPPRQSLRALLYVFCPSFLPSCTSYRVFSPRIILFCLPVMAATKKHLHHQFLCDSFQLTFCANQ